MSEAKAREPRHQREQPDFGRAEAIGNRVLEVDDALGRTLVRERSGEERTHVAGGDARLVGKAGGPRRVLEQQRLAALHHLAHGRAAHPVLVHRQVGGLVVAGADHLGLGRVGMAEQDIAALRRGALDELIHQRLTEGAQGRTLERHQGVEDGLCSPVRSRLAGHALTLPSRAHDAGSVALSATPGLRARGCRRSDDIAVQLHDLESIDL